MTYILLGVIIGVASTLIGAGILALIRWTRVDGNRWKLKQKTGRHDWRRHAEEPPGSPIVMIRISDEECQKCGAQR